MGSTAEGVATTRAAFKLVLKLKVDAPIITLMHKVLFEGMKPDDALRILATREMKRENYGWDAKGKL